LLESLALPPPFRFSSHTILMCPRKKKDFML
jgi:hypothetical protein